MLRSLVLSAFTVALFALTGSSRLPVPDMPDWPLSEDVLDDWPGVYLSVCLERWDYPGGILPWPAGLPHAVSYGNMASEAASEVDATFAVLGPGGDVVLLREIWFLAAGGLAGGAFVDRVWAMEWDGPDDVTVSTPQLPGHSVRFRRTARCGFDEVDA